MRLLRYRGDRRALRAFEQRQELVRAGLTRRDLVRMGLITGGGVGGGMLLAEKGLARDLRSPGALGALPPLKAFDQELTIPQELPARALGELSPAPGVQPNRAPEKLPNGLPVEGRSEAHQSGDVFPAQKYFVTRMAATQAQVHPDLPPATFWGFNDGDPDLVGHPPTSPGPLLVLRYGEPAIVRRYNQLPAPEDNGGFGVPEVSTHLHNFHTAPDSDGGPCDPKEQRFFFRDQYYDYFYNMQFAGWGSTNKEVDDQGVRGDVREAVGFLWYHDHRVDHTAENTYKGLVGPAFLFNAFDTGDESTGLRLPHYPDFDIPLVFGDRLFDPNTGQLAFDLFNTDGILGNVFLVNGRSQPAYEVKQRRYRLRLLDAGPSRFYEFFLTNPDQPDQQIPFWVIAVDGNLLPRPIEVTSYTMGVAERTDVIVDFKKIADRFGAKRIHLENRLEQVNGRGPTGKVFGPGQGDQLLEFQLGAVEEDGSFDPEPVASPGVEAVLGDSIFDPIGLPDIAAAEPRITRRFRFERGNGGWQINGRFMDCTQFRFRPEMNKFERWIVQNNSGGWAHPIHIHFEEFRIISRDGVASLPGQIEFCRKDVMILADEEIEILVRFRDMVGGYPIHCHNTVHEDHQMMMLYEVAEHGDNLTEP